MPEGPYGPSGILSDISLNVSTRAPSRCDIEHCNIVDIEALSSTRRPLRKTDTTQNLRLAHTCSAGAQADKILSTKRVQACMVFAYAYCKKYHSGFRLALYSDIGF